VVSLIEDVLDIVDGVEELKDLLISISEKAPQFWLGCTLTESGISSDSSSKSFPNPVNSTGGSSSSTGGSSSSLFLFSVDRNEVSGFLN